MASRRRTPVVTPVTADETVQRASGVMGRMNRRHIASALFLGAALGLGACSAGADAKPAELDLPEQVPAPAEGAATDSAGDTAIQTQPTALPKPGSDTSADSSIAGDPIPTPGTRSDGGFAAVQDLEWPFTVEPPEGSEILPFHAALMVYSSRLDEEWEWVISERERIDPQVRELVILRDAGEITPEQQQELLDFQDYLWNAVDNVIVMVDTESKPDNKLNTVMTNLRMGIWDVSYEGDGIWHVSDGAGGIRSYDEVSLEIKKISGFESP